MREVVYGCSGAVTLPVKALSLPLGKREYLASLFAEIRAVGFIMDCLQFKIRNFVWRGVSLAPSVCLYSSLVTIQIKPSVS